MMFVISFYFLVAPFLAIQKKRAAIAAREAARKRKRAAVAPESSVEADKPAVDPSTLVAEPGMCIECLDKEATIIYPDCEGDVFCTSCFLDLHERRKTRMSRKMALHKAIGYEYSTSSVKKVIKVD